MYYHNLSPDALSLGPLTIKWYGLMYILGLLLAWLLARTRMPKGWQAQTLNDLVFYSAWGIILGGRIGYWLFYQAIPLQTSPLSILKIWQGGMSFHGGLLGVVIAILLFCRRYQQKFLLVADLISTLAPIGLFLGRIGNFINGELWGRVATVSWSVIFPAIDLQPRHPSQLYEALTEGLLLFVILWIYGRKTRELGRVSGLFLIGYTIARSISECFREPDYHLGFLLNTNWLTQGQLLSLPMLLIGIWLLTRKVKA